ncbi:hypothetical protein QTI66_22815 [Variovorax sp. J22R133]|uniref:hypothetical protein n=1 Tax=Variovorax brevis TaxID=3053503 RepID=UPI0025750D0D|nr:hypothetical protein [Variovorax sp. J22R133]MDM0114999.1 hypothetical protein [Variovorax sp. J22R133]
MNDLTQPFVKLSTANAELMTRFAQSPEVAELVNTNAQKYLELAQKAFGGAAASSAHADLVRSLAENYATFAREHAENLMGIFAGGQAAVAQQVQAASERMAEATHAKTR